MFRLAVAVSLLSGCYLKQFPVTPQVAEDSTYKLFAGDYQGTAWVLDDTHVMTAGHMCEGTSTDPDILVSSTGRRTLATPLAWEYGYDGDSEATAPADLCILTAVGPLAPPLVLADEMPRVGEAVGYVGWPRGAFVERSGKYLGDLDVGHEDDFVSSTPCDHGASGSAMFTRAGVFGVLVRLRTDGGDMHDGKDGCAAVGLDAMRAFINWAGVTYVPQPDDPTNRYFDRD